MATPKEADPPPAVDTDDGEDAPTATPKRKRTTSPKTRKKRPAVKYDFDQRPQHLTILNKDQERRRDQGVGCSRCRYSLKGCDQCK